jgi:hypothetical protein
VAEPAPAGRQRPARSSAIPDPAARDPVPPALPADATSVEADGSGADRPGGPTVTLASSPDAEPKSAMGDAWEALLDGVSRRKASLAGMLAGLEPPELEGDDLVLRVPGDQPFVAEALREDRNRRLIEEVLGEVWPGPERIRLETGEAARAPEGAAAFRRLQRDDPLVQRVLEVFDADFVG